MTGDISVEIQGLESVMSRIRRLPDELKNQVLDDVSDYSLEVVREYPPQKYVTRRAAYGQTFFSDKQRKFFFAALRDGRISVPGVRTGALADAWSVQRNSSGAVFSNTKSYAPYVMGAIGQSRHEKLVGWKKINEIIDRQLSFQSSKFRNVVQKAYQKAIRKLQLGG